MAVVWKPYELAPFCAEMFVAQCGCVGRAAAGACHATCPVSQVPSCGCV